jgi:hypothetical protein
LSRPRPVVSVTPAPSNATFGALCDHAHYADPLLAKNDDIVNQEVVSALSLELSAT